MLAQKAKIQVQTTHKRRDGPTKKPLAKDVFEVVCMHAKSTAPCFIVLFFRESTAMSVLFCGFTRLAGGNTGCFLSL